MSLTPVKTEKVYGRITHVQIGYDEDHGVDITQGIKSFRYNRVHDAKTAFNVSAKTASDVFQPHSNFDWRLEFVSDCRIAFFGTDVQVGGNDEYALVNTGDSNKIEYFRVIMPIVDSSGEERTRTYIITNGYVLRNGAEIGDDESAVYWYEGIAESVYYEDG